MTTQLTDEEVMKAYFGAGGIRHGIVPMVRAIIAAHEAKQAQGKAVLKLIVSRHTQTVKRITTEWLDAHLDLPDGEHCLYTRQQQGEDARWIPCAERLPEILPNGSHSAEVIAGYWYTDPHVVDTSPNKRIFIFGTARLITDGRSKFWERFGNLATHWMPVNPPAIAAQKGEE